MKKILTTASIVAAMGMMSVSAFADFVYITISDENGKLAVAQEKVELTDADGDGALTAYDAFVNAHDQLFDGGADAGFAAEEGDYGLFITKLWGVENGGSYGYYLNNHSASGLTDPVKSGDGVSAFIYTDLEAWSDTFCYFEESIQDDCVLITEAESGKEVTYTLLASAFDENWAPITVPVSGAELLIDGQKTGAITDENGKATVTVPAAEGEHIVSAVSDSQLLVPPAAKLITVADMHANEAEVDDVTVVTGTVTAGDVAAASESSKGSPDTGIEDIAVIAGIALLAGGAVAVSRRRK